MAQTKRAFAQEASVNLQFALNRASIAVVTHHARHYRAELNSASRRWKWCTPASRVGE